MAAYDVAIVGSIMAGMVWGAVRGITWQIASIASLALGYTAAHTLSPQLAPKMPGAPVVARALAMMAVTGRFKTSQLWALQNQPPFRWVFFLRIHALERSVIKITSGRSRVACLL